MQHNDQDKKGWVHLLTKNSYKKGCISDLGLMVHAENVFLRSEPRYNSGKELKVLDN